MDRKGRPRKSVIESVKNDEQSMSILESVQDDGPFTQHIHTPKLRLKYNNK
jgi:hypothetical protein